MLPISFFVFASSSYIVDFPTNLSNPDTVEITFQKEVDINQSEFWYDNKQIFSENGKISFYVENENSTTFTYVLRNSNGEILDEGREMIYLDSQAPQIIVRNEYGNVNENLYLKEESYIQVDVEDMNLKEYQIYLDGELVSLSSQANILVKKENKEIKIIANDEYSHSAEKIIRIYPIKDIVGSCNIEYDSYTLEDHLSLKFDDIIDIPMDLIVYVDSIERSRFDILNQSTFDINLDTTGDISLKVVCQGNDNIPIQLFGYDSYIFHFSNEKPYINLSSNTTYSNQDIYVYTNYNCRYMQSSFMEIWDGSKWIQSDLVDWFLFEAKENQEIQYYAKATIVDMFNQSASSEILCTTDLKGPFFQLSRNNQLVNPNETLEIDKTDLFTFITGEPSTIKMVIYKNGELIEDVKLETIIHNLTQEDVLDVRYILNDTLQNTSEYQYFLKLKPIYLPQTFITEYMIPSSNTWNMDSAKVIHEWEVNDDNQLVHKKKKVKIKDTTKPKIEWIEDKNKVRIVLMKDSTGTNEYFQSIKINNKNIDLENLQLDSLQNPYYEFTFRKKCIVEVVAKDEAGNTTILNKEFSKSKQSVC